MTTLIDNLEKMRTRRQTQANVLCEELAVITQAIQALERYVIEQSAADRGQQPRGRPPRPEGELSPLVQAMVNTLRANSGIMHRKALYDALIAQGIKFPGVDPLKNCAAHLSLHKRVFKPLGGGMWTLIYQQMESE